jgi:hypothetical protein
MADDGTAGVGGKVRTTARQVVTEPLATGTLATGTLEPEILATAKPPTAQD